MNQRAIRALVRKDLKVVVQSKAVLLPIIIVPLLMLAIPLVMLFVMARVPISNQDMQEIEPMLRNPVFAGMTPLEAMRLARVRLVTGKVTRSWTTLNASRNSTSLNVKRVNWNARPNSSINRSPSCRPQSKPILLSIELP